MSCCRAAARFRTSPTTSKHTRPSANRALMLGNYLFTTASFGRSDRKRFGRLPYSWTRCIPRGRK